MSSATSSASRLVRRLSRQNRSIVAPRRPQLCLQTYFSFGYHQYPPNSVIYPRSLSTTVASKPSILAALVPPTFAPSSEDVEDAEYDVELVPPEEAKLRISESAAEKLRSISVRESDPNVALRIAVESGGCHGYQYKMDLTSDRQPEDYLFSHPTLKPSNVIVDAMSLGLLKGSTLDYATELIGSSFRVLDNPQAKGSGCGCGVSWELKE